jgi:hypothetical protein
LRPQTERSHAGFLNATAAGLLAALLLAPAVVQADSSSWSVEETKEHGTLAIGTSASLGLQLNPFQIHGFSRGEIRIFESYTTALRATDLRTAGDVLGVWDPDTRLASIHDNPSIETKLACRPPVSPGIPPGPCRITFPEGAQIVTESSPASVVKQYHVSLRADVADSLIPCVRVSVRGSGQAAGSVLEFLGDANMVWHEHHQ